MLNPLPRLSTCLLAAGLLTSCAATQHFFGLESAPAGKAPVLQTLDASKLEWKAITFGQSTDMNFSSNVPAAKVGINEVIINGQKIGADYRGDLASPISMESRGGKVGNSHDGITFYYTEVSSANNFVLETDVSVEQLGSELAGVAPNYQEGAGLLVRDTIGVPRQVPMRAGYEEFPAASNIVGNAVMAQTRKVGSPLAIQTLLRNGINQPWGNTGAIYPRDTYKDNIESKNARFKLKLARTNTGFVASYADGRNAVEKTVAGANSDIVNVIEPDRMYVGFFAARNAKVTFSNAKLSLSAAQTVQGPKFIAKPYALRFELASPEVSATDAYTLQARANYDGRISMVQDGKTVVSDANVVAGQHFAYPTRITAAASQFQLAFTPSAGPTREVQKIELTVIHSALANPANLYAAPNGKPDSAGTQAAPLDLASAAKLLPPGGTLTLLEGEYGETTLPISLSGTASAPKQLIAAGKVQFRKTFRLDASYWQLKGIEMAGASLYVSGSHNLIERVIAHDSPDTGIQISSPDIGRPLWARDNLVLNSDSYDNVDPSMTNADGFAAKIRVGDGNTFRGCIAHNNIDDGWDLFNKIEDGPNGVVTIEDSISYGNGKLSYRPASEGAIGNGFKLGGEGQPVGHIVRNNIAFDNLMDGYTDNFNPGRFVVENNIAFNNARFNYLFRPSPYGGPETQGRFAGNLSLHADVKGKYTDAITGTLAGNNVLFTGNQSSVGLNEFLSIRAPLRFERDQDGNIIRGNFLRRKAAAQ